MAVGRPFIDAPIGRGFLSFEGVHPCVGAVLDSHPGLLIAAGGLLVLGSALGAFLVVRRRRKAGRAGGLDGALAAEPAGRQRGQEEATRHHLDALARMAELTAQLAAGDGAEDLCRTVAATENRDGEVIGALSADSLAPRRPWGEFADRLLRLYSVRGEWWKSMATAC